jgi:hypothetical protein
MMFLVFLPVILGYGERIEPAAAYPASHAHECRVTAKKLNTGVEMVEMMAFKGRYECLPATSLRLRNVANGAKMVYSPP